MVLSVTANRTLLRNVALQDGLTEPQQASHDPLVVCPEHLDQARLIASSSTRD
jgi:hypothetical protein